jgi:leader peptidase (prepilin peptidase)/N-methyltransferase
MLAGAIAFLFGSVIGSFLNVCIHRMPLGESVVWPSSHCPHCKKRLPAYDNIPFISYLLLKGRCRACQRRIPLRYPLVELLTGIIFVLVFARYGLSYDLFFYIVFLAALIIASFIDIKHRIIPDEVSLGGAIVGFILSSTRGFRLEHLSWDYRPVVDSLLGVITGAAVIYLTGFIFDLVYFRLLKRPPIQGETSSMGGGDVKLMAMIGAFLGWQKALLTFFLAPFFGALVGVIVLITKKDHTIAYGPFLSLGALLALFYGPQILRLFFPFY